MGAAVATDYSTDYSTEILSRATEYSRGCSHANAPVIVSRGRGFVLRGDCGDRRYCRAARRRWRYQMRQRLERVGYLRAPDLWTFTVATREQDALYLAALQISQWRRRGEFVHPSLTAANLAPEVLYRAKDRGDASDPESVKRLSVGISRVLRKLHEQHKRQREINYLSTRKARELKEKYGTAFPVRGRPGAAFRIRVKEIGESGERLHAHAASDFDFIWQPWLNDLALRHGLGFVQFSRKDSKTLRAAARASGPRIRNRVIARYVSKYLGKAADDEKPWPWPKHTRIVSAARGELPPREPATDCFVKFGQSVAFVALTEFGVVLDDETQRKVNRCGFVDLSAGRAPP